MATATRAPDPPDAPSAADVLLTARAYRGTLGWCVVPVGWREKKPAGGDGWQKQALANTDADLQRHFRQRRNLGVLMGTPSGHLVDVDLDCPEAVELAAHYLPTTWTFGRGATPRLHWIYVAKGACSEAFTDGVDGKKMVELRADKEKKPGESAGQTVFPPSVHASSGELIRWTEDCDAQEGPRVIDAADLRRAVARLAAACLVMRRAGRAAAEAWLRGGQCPSLCPVGCKHQDKGNAPCPTRLFRKWHELPNVEPQPKATALRRAARSSDEIDDAVERYNAAHPRSFPSTGSECPVCGSQKSFKHHADTETRWVCWSTRHGKYAVGVQGDTTSGGIWSGDALDLDAHANRIDRVALLRRENYLKKGKR